MEQLSAVSSQLAAARLIAGATDQIFSWDAFTLNHYQPESQRVKAVLSIDLLDGARREVPPSNPDSRPSPLAREIIARGAKLILRDGANRDSMDAASFGDKSRRSASLMYVPVHRGIRVIGILSVQSYRPQAWSPEDLDLLQAIADLCAGAIGRLDAEQSLIENEARLALAQSVAGLGSFDVDLSTGHTVWSPELYCLWNREPRLGPMSKDEVFAAMHPEDSDRLRPIYEKFLIEGDTYEGPYRVLNADGSLRHVHSKAKIIRDAQGCRVRVIGAVQDITEQVQAEESIRESAQRLAEAQAIAHVGSYEFNIRTGVRHWSAETCRLWGRDPLLGPMQPAEVLAMIHPDDRDRFSAAMSRTLQEGAPMEADFRIGLPDGTLRHLFAKAAVARDSDGRPLQVIGTVQDISERKRAEASLRLFRTLIDQANDAFEIIEPDTGRFLDMNERGCADLGYTRDEILSLHLVDISPDFGPERLRSLLAQLRESGGARIETQHRRQDGLTFPVEVHCRIVPLDREYLVAVARNITERKKTGDALRASEERYRLLADTSDDFVTLLEPNGRQLYVSPAYLRITGWTMEDLRAKDWRTRVHPDDIPHVEKSRAANLAGETTTIEQRVLCRDDSVIWVELRCKPFIGADGRVEKLLLWSRDITKRKRAEEALRKSETQYRQLVELAQEGIWSIDAANLTTYANPRMAEMLGYTMEEMLGKPLFDFMDDRGIKLAEKNVERRRQGITEEHEFEFIRQDGRRIITSMNTSPITDSAGTYRGAIAWVADITERKRLDQILRASEERFRAFMDNSPAIAWIKDHQGRHVYLNKYYEQRFGVRLQDWLGKTDFEVWPAEVAEQFHLNDQRVLAGGQTVEVVEETINPDASRTHWWNFKFVLHDADGHPYIGGFGIDITERKQAEEALRMHSAVLLNMSDAILITDHDETIIDCNPAAELLFGYPVAELVGQLPTLLHRPAERPTLMQAVRSGVLGQGFWRGEICFVRKNGSEGHCDTVCVPLRNDRGEHIATISVNRDITEQRQLKQQILEIGDLERDRIGQDLHDGLCQQLISVAFTANQLNRQLKGRAGPARAVAQDIAESLDDAITHARQIARGLYPVSLQAGGLPSALQELATQVKQRSQMNCAVDADEAITINDPTAATHLFRIAQESVNNAVKHARARHIVIRLKQADERLELSVADDGEGLPTEERRADAMGMQILEYRSGAIGAKLEIESQPGSGTTVRCSVPLKAIK